MVTAPVELANQLATIGVPERDRNIPGRQIPLVDHVTAREVACDEIKAAIPSRHGPDSFLVVRADSGPASRSAPRSVAAHNDAPALWKSPATRKGSAAAPPSPRRRRLTSPATRALCRCACRPPTMPRRSRHRSRRCAGCRAAQQSPRALAAVDSSLTPLAGANSGSAVYRSENPATVTSRASWVRAAAGTP